MIIVGSLAGLDMIWFIGDEFMDRTFTEHFRHYRNADKLSNFTVSNYEIMSYATTRYASSIRNI